MGSGIRPFTFFEKGVVGHVGFADPFDAKLAEVSRSFTFLRNFTIY